MAASQSNDPPSSPWPELLATAAEPVIRLRRAAAADVAAVRALTRAAYAPWVPVLGREPMPMLADYETAIRKHRIDLLQCGESLAGLIETVDAGDHLLIENVAVAPAQQGRGLGRMLMAHAEDLAARSGMKRLRLYTNKLMDRNVRFYRSLGYRVDREAPGARGGTVVHLSKAVPRPG